jgi:hypothetical protein
MFAVIFNKYYAFAAIRQKIGPTLRSILNPINNSGEAQESQLVPIFMPIVIVSC